MSIFEPSPFWHAFRRLWSLRAIGIFAIFALCLDLTGRVAPSLIGVQVHQRYLYTTRTSEVDDTTLSKQITWVANGRGARGDLYHGQPTEIAVFGSSTSEDWGLDQQKTWAQQVKLTLGGRSHHVDNYARNDSYHGEAIVILEELARTGRRYDIILLMVAIDPRVSRDSPENAFFFWGQWRSRYSGILQPWHLLYRRLSAQAMSEPRLMAVREWVVRLNSTPAPPRRHPQRNARSNRVLRNDGKIRLQYAPLKQFPGLGDDDRPIVERETKRLLEAAHEVGDSVFFVAQPVAYDENELAGVAERWFSLYPIENQDAYHDNRSVAESIRKSTAVMADVAETLGVPVIDVDAHMRTLLAERDDLFFDKWHYTEAGAEVAAQCIADFLRKDGAAGQFNH
jgi:hypothetical protein